MSLRVPKENDPPSIQVIAMPALFTQLRTQWRAAGDFAGLVPAQDDVTCVEVSGRKESQTLDW